MSEQILTGQILMITLGILVGFGLIVCAMSIVFKSKGKSVKSIWTKYLAWFVLIPPILLPLLYSRILFQAVILMLSLLCLREFSHATGLWKDKKINIACYFAIICIYLPVFDGWYGLYQAVPIFMIAFILIIPVIRSEYEHMIQKTCLSVLGVAYFGWFFSHLGYLRNYPNGVGYIFYLLVLVESNDALGYLWGNLLGKHKLIPSISPNKTVEGAVGALLSVIGLGFLFRFVIPHISAFHIFLFSFLISIFGICGDLTISFIKRDLKIKDMGTVIPGHGGLLDRFDSIIFTAPLYFHLIRYFYE